jgi:hypothetical protein
MLLLCSFTSSTFIIFPLYKKLSIFFIRRSNQTTSKTLIEVNVALAQDRFLGQGHSLVVEQHPAFLISDVGHIMTAVDRFSQMDYHCLQTILSMGWIAQFDFFYFLVFLQEIQIVVNISIDTEKPFERSLDVIFLNFSMRVRFG